MILCSHHTLSTLNTHTVMFDFYLDNFYAHITVGRQETTTIKVNRSRTKPENPFPTHLLDPLDVPASSRLNVDGVEVILGAVQLA